MKDVYIDFETFSEIDLRACGAYRYINHKSFEPLIMAFAVDNAKASYIDLTEDELDETVIDILLDESVTIHAHNATFERLILNNYYKLNIPINRFSCSMALAAYNGLPLSLDNATAALGLDELKDSAGTALINFFSKPRKPSKNNPAVRNFPEDAPDKWDMFIEYCMQDVEAERSLVKALSKYPLPESEKRIYEIDQIINDRGVKLNADFLKNAIKLDTVISKNIKDQLKELTNLDNPNSPVQVCDWLTEQLGKPVKSIAKERIEEIGKDPKCTGLVKNYIELRKKSAKTSVKKYTKAEQYRSPEDGRARGLIQYYGAMRTGRFAGRGIQVQNLPRNKTPYLDEARETVLSGDPDLLNILFDNPKDILSQLTRTMFEADDNRKFLVIDYSAIEARVLAWIAGEQWRLDVFNTHGKIYEASAAAMFKVPIESIGKGSDLRSRGKVAELALGYGGSVGAMQKMGGDKLGMSPKEIKNVVDLWRLANPAIVSFWKNINDVAVYAVSNPGTTVKDKTGRFRFFSNKKCLAIELPSKRCLVYQNPHFTINKFGNKSLAYWGVDESAKGSSWVEIETYGGKLTENVTQAIARDLLAEALVNLHNAKFRPVMHIHDEIVIEEVDFMTNLKFKYDEAVTIMCKNPKWADGLPLNADGFISKFYRKED